MKAFYDLSTGTICDLLDGIDVVDPADIPAGKGVIDIPSGTDLRFVSVVGGVLAIAAQAEIDSAKLEQERAKALNYTDKKAGNVRLQWISTGIGQEMVYTKKYEEGVAFENDQSPNASLYPHIYGRAARLSIPASEVAQTFREKGAVWLAVSASIEDVREATKELIQTATTIAAIKTIVKTASWPVLEP